MSHIILSIKTKKNKYNFEIIIYRTTQKNTPFEIYTVILLHNAKIFLKTLQKNGKTKITKFQSLTIITQNHSNLNTRNT